MTASEEPEIELSAAARRRFRRVETVWYARRALKSVGLLVVFAFVAPMLFGEPRSHEWLQPLRFLEEPRPTGRRCGFGYSPSAEWRGAMFVTLLTVLIAGEALVQASRRRLLWPTLALLLGSSALMWWNTVTSWL